MVNLSILTADFYALLFGLFVFKYAVSERFSFALSAVQAVQFTVNYESLLVFSRWASVKTCRLILKSMRSYAEYLRTRLDSGKQVYMNLFSQG